ncbi:MAG: hypothetical protein Ct9H90mP16_03090 [Candidatus Poseidoniales archaeon]|nr:MAG: hypothetical protein Ct9H90mP16_03090 [Candidatus Poseidoniales archaeon]
MMHHGHTPSMPIHGWTLKNLATPYVLPAGGYAIIAENNQGTLKLNNAGEILDLIDSAGTSVHTVTTGQASSDVSKIPGSLPTDDYVDSNSNTPGAANTGVPQQVPNLCKVKCESQKSCPTLTGPMTMQHGQVANG